MYIKYTEGGLEGFTTFRIKFRSPGDHKTKYFMVCYKLAYNLFFYLTAVKDTVNKTNLVPPKVLLFCIFKYSTKLKKLKKNKKLYVSEWIDIKVRWVMNASLLKHLEIKKCKYENFCLDYQISKCYIKGNFLQSNRNK